METNWQSGTLEDAVGHVRQILKWRPEDGYLRAIKYLRMKGLTFTTARTMVREIQQDAPWWRNY